MVDLMAEGAREETLARHLDGLAMRVLGADGHALRTHHDAGSAGHAQAPFRAALLALGGYDFGIDQLNQALPHVHHDRPLEDAHLRRSQAHAVGLVHGVCHILEQNTQAQVEFLYLFGMLAQLLVSDFHNFSGCHFRPNSLFPYIIVAGLTSQ